MQISIGAQRASAETDDAKKDGAKVKSDARAALDKDGLSATGAMSGRALAVVGLNEDGTFSRADTQIREIAAWLDQVRDAYVLADGTLPPPPNSLAATIIPLTRGTARMQARSSVIERRSRG